MGEPPQGTSLDRIDNNGDYTPENCVWSTRAKQNRNKRSNINIEYTGKIQCLFDWSQEYNINYRTLIYRLKRNMSFEEAITKPVQTSNARIKLEKY